jgi:hypothetical protein
VNNLYPRFQESYTQDELIENFWLTNDEIVFVETFRSEVNRQAVAVLLKSLNYLGFFLEGFDEVPESVKTFIARGLNSLWDVTDQYDWLSSAKDRHYSQIREFSGWHPATSNDKENLARWLEENAAGEIGSEEELFETAARRCQHLRIELPSRKELERLTATVWNNIFQTIYRNIDEKLSSEQKQKLDELLIVKDTKSFSVFDKLKSLSGKAGVENFSKEADKLKQIKEIKFPAELSSKIPPKLLRILSRRALLYEHINPHGVFEIDVTRPSFLQKEIA